MATELVTVSQSLGPDEVLQPVVFLPTPDYSRSSAWDDQQCDHQQADDTPFPHDCRQPELIIKSCVSTAKSRACLSRNAAAFLMDYRGAGQTAYAAISRFPASNPQ